MVSTNVLRRGNSTLCLDRLHNQKIMGCKKKVDNNWASGKKRSGYKEKNAVKLNTIQCTIK